jgi:ubiquinone/menaquinone biosynthesis C-methylase UbiE
MTQRAWQNWDAPGVVEWLDGDWPRLPVDPALSALVDLVEIHHRSGPILEVGCGTGRTHEALMRRLVLRPHGYVGVDVTPAMVERASAHYPEADLREGDALDLPFAGGAFGAVVCTDVLQHLPEIDRPIAEMLRVAREHVFLLLRLRKADAPRQRPALVPIEVPEHGVRTSLYQLARSDEEVIAACRRAGGKVLDFQVVDGADDDAGLVRVGVRR